VSRWIANREGHTSFRHAQKRHAASYARLIPIAELLDLCCVEIGSEEPEEMSGEWLRGCVVVDVLILASSLENAESEFLSAEMEEDDL
jgi:hypothetical protein